MKTLHKIASLFKGKYLLTLGLLLPFIGHAQEPAPMAETFRSNGKIYVVVLVICTIFAGIILFLVNLERKIKKLEKNQTK
jgi:hypothetical protein